MAPMGVSVGAWCGWELMLVPCRGVGCEADFTSSRLVLGRRPVNQRGSQDREVRRRGQHEEAAEAGERKLEAAGGESEPAEAGPDEVADLRGGRADARD